MTPTLEDVYALIPKIECQKKCHGSCGPISMSSVERVRMVRANGGPLPMVDVKKFHADNVDGVKVGKDLSTMDTPDVGEGAHHWEIRCALLTKEGLCSIHEARPLICRLWGVAKEMPCLWGCKPERVMTRDEVDVVFQLLKLVPGNEKGKSHHTLPRPMMRDFAEIARAVAVDGKVREATLG